MATSFRSARSRSAHRPSGSSSFGGASTGRPRLRSMCVSSRKRREQPSSLSIGASRSSARTARRSRDGGGAGGRESFEPSPHARQVVSPLLGQTAQPVGEIVQRCGQVWQERVRAGLGQPAVGGDGLLDGAQALLPPTQPAEVHPRPRTRTPERGPRRAYCADGRRPRRPARPNASSTIANSPIRCSRFT